MDSLDNYNMMSPAKIVGVTERKGSAMFIRTGSGEQVVKKGGDSKKGSSGSGSKQVNTSTTKEKKYLKQSTEKVKKDTTLVNSSSTVNVGNVSKGEVSRFGQKTTTATPTLKRSKI
jgi:hypothetical protein